MFKMMVSTVNFNEADKSVDCFIVLNTKQLKTILI